jgi:hypothetical protein
MSEHSFANIEELGVDQLKRQSKIPDLVFAGAQVDAISTTGAKVFKVGAVSAVDLTGPLHTIVVDERGQKLDLKSLPDGERQRLFGGPRRRWIQYSYAVKFVCGVQEAADGCCCATVRPGAYATEINIFNYQDYEWAYLSKRVMPVVQGGLPLGREPRSVTAKGWDWMALPPGSATMDDCCRINHLLFDAEPVGKPSLTIGFLEIVSDRELQVTAVYTATDLESRSISIEVESISPKIKYPYYWSIPEGPFVPAETGKAAAQ